MTARVKQLRKAAGIDCSTCIYQHSSRPALCIRRSPVLLEVDGETMSGWPETRDGQCCGEWVGLDDNGTEVDYSRAIANAVYEAQRREQEERDRCPQCGFVPGDLRCNCSCIPEGSDDHD